jgi:hypothetical protein
VGGQALLGVGAGTALLGPFVSAVFGSTRYIRLEEMGSVVVGMSLAIAGAIWLLVGGRRLSIKHADENHAWVAGCSKEFIASLPDISAAYEAHSQAVKQSALALETLAETSHTSESAELTK